jgi:RHS repeat-associated protein
VQAYTSIKRLANPLAKKACFRLVSLLQTISSTMSGFLCTFTDKINLMSNQSVREPSVMHSQSHVRRTTRMTIRFFHNDQNGTPAAVTSEDGSITWHASHKAWGRAQPERREGSGHQPLRYQGQYCDEEAGLHYNRHRYYDPDIGRFLTQDPIGLSGGINLYLYAPNPGAWIDPLGLINLNLAGPLYQPWASTFTHGTNYFSVLSHGNPSGLTGIVTGDHIPPQQLAQTIRRTPGYRRDQTILLVACHAGSERNLANPQNSSYAQELADEMQQPVIAPSGKINSGSYNGTGFVYPEGNSAWRNFAPEPYVLTVL